MRTAKNLAATVCAVVAVVAFSTATPVKAQEPHYIHALEELRTARDYLTYDQAHYDAERRHAVAEIDMAVQEIRHAASDDGKQTRFMPPGNASKDWAPMHYAQIALVAARKFVGQGVDTPANNGLRARADHHISEAELALVTILHQGAP